MERPHEYGDTFAQVVRHETVRCFFAAAAQDGSLLRSIDVCSAFLTSPINRTVYMHAPEGFERPGYCIRLGASIYGTADAPRAYHKDFDKYLAQLEIRPTQADTCLYTSTNVRYPDLQIIEYVDDLVLKGSAVSIENFLHDLQLKYKIRDYGEPKSFLGMEVTRDKKARTIKTYPVGLHSTVGSRA